MTGVTRDLLRAFEDCRTGNLKDLKFLIANGLPIDSTVRFFANSSYHCPFSVYHAHI
jgi:hypothetical protein